MKWPAHLLFSCVSFLFLCLSIETKNLEMIISFCLTTLFWVCLSNYSYFETLNKFKRCLVNVSALGSGLFIFSNLVFIVKSLTVGV